MLSILYLEDNRIDAQLIQQVLKTENVKAEVEVVGSRLGFEAAMEGGEYDLVLADYNLPDINALEAIRYLRGRNIDIPILLVSGAISGESAVEVLKAGANDYILKDHLERLVPALNRSLDQYQQQKRIEAHELEIQKTNTILSQAEMLGQMGAFEWDFVDNTMTWTPGMYLICDLQLEDFTPTLEKIIPIIHPEDLQALSDKVMGMSRSQGHAPYAFTEVFRLKAQNGQLKYVRSRGEVFFDSLRSPLRMVGVVQDITPHKEAEEAIQKLNEELEQKVLERTQALARSEKKYRLISDNMTDLITLHQEPSKMASVSRSVKDLLGYSPKEFAASPTHALLHPDDYAKVIPRLYQAIEEKEESLTLEFQVKNKEGEYVWMESHLRIMPSDLKEGDIQVQASSRDITRRKLAELQKEIALEKEKELNDLRAQFVSMASHQFRTPLSIIRSNVELLELLMERSGKPQEERITKYKHILARLNGEVDRLTSLMDDIMEMGKIESGKISPVPEEIELLPFLEELSIAEARQHGSQALVIRQVGEAYPVYLDPRLISHALTNIIGNALKYSKGRPEPELDVIFEEDEIQIRVKDYGIGIPKQDQQKLFDSWYRASNVKGVSGTGLGLSISKKLVEAHGGSIVLDSDLGEGAEFNVILPKEGSKNI